jgi:hypothetical protein
VAGDCVGARKIGALERYGALERSGAKGKILARSKDMARSADHTRERRALASAALPPRASAVTAASITITNNKQKH